MNEHERRLRRMMAEYRVLDGQDDEAILYALRAIEEREKLLKALKAEAEVSQMPDLLRLVAECEE